jgi:hypothetical protein
MEQTQTSYCLSMLKERNKHKKKVDMKKERGVRIPNKCEKAFVKFGV